MKNLFIILFLFSLSAYANPKGETLGDELIGTWKIKNVQKMQGLVIRTEKYTKDGGDPKAYIAKFKGSTITFNADSTVVLVTPNGKRTIQGKWAFVNDSKYQMGSGNSVGDNRISIPIIKLEIKFPTARAFNIDGEYKDRQFGVAKVEGLFAIVDPKYMFKFKKVVEGEEDKVEEEEDEKEK